AHAQPAIPCSDAVRPSWGGRREGDGDRRHTTPGPRVPRPSTPDHAYFLPHRAFPTVRRFPRMSDGAPKKGEASAAAAAETKGRHAVSDALDRRRASTRMSSEPDSLYRLL